MASQRYNTTTTTQSYKTTIATINTDRIDRHPHTRLQGIPVRAHQTLAVS